MNLNAVSVIIAVVAVLFAMIEAITKYCGKISERKTLFYTKYIYICQQLQIGVLAVGKLLDMIEEESISQKQIVGFAKAHFISDDVLKCIYDYQELAFICLKGKGIQEVRMALNFGATALSNAESINAVFHSVISNEENTSNMEQLCGSLTTQEMRCMHNDMNDTLTQLKEVGGTSEDMLLPNDKTLRTVMYETVKYQRKIGDYIHGGYIAICLLLLVLCIFYIVCLVFNINL